MNDYPPSRGAGSNQIPPRHEEVGGRRFGAWVVAASASLIAVVVLFAFEPSHSGFYPICYFHRTTGLLCPGCGSLRALHQLLHGHVAAALHDNALLMLSLPWFGWLAFRALLGKIRNQPVPLHVPPVWLWLAFGVLVVFGVLRNLPFAHRLWLAP